MTSAPEMGPDRKADKPAKDPVPREAPRPQSIRTWGNPVKIYQKNREVATPDRDTLT